MCNLTFCSWKCIGNIRNASNYKVNFMEILILYTVMSLGNILFEHSVSNRKEIRVIESINRKLINGKAALSFNEHCHNNNLLPSYTNIYIYISPRADGVWRATRPDEGGGGGEGPLRIFKSKNRRVKIQTVLERSRRTLQDTVMLTLFFTCDVTGRKVKQGQTVLIYSSQLFVT